MTLLPYLPSLLLTLLVSCSESLNIQPTRKLNQRLARREALVPILTLPLLVDPQRIGALDMSTFQEGPRGLKYLVTNEGTGAKPERAQKVKTSYSLYLNGFKEDGGTLVDSSNGFLGEKPFEFNVGVRMVIKGWDLALMDMKEGEARRLVIPSDLGYGAKGAGSKIPGGATLYFDVKLTELGKMPTLGPDQLKWLEENPL